MKLCFVCSEYPPAIHGGIGSATQTLARELVRLGHEVRVIGVYPSQQAGEPYRDDEGVRVYSLFEPPGRLGWLSARYQLFKTIRDWVREGLADIVEVPDYRGWAAGWPKLPVPVVSRIHGSSSFIARETGQKLDRISHFIEGWSLRRADVWCSVSQFAAQATRSLFALRTDAAAVLYNPVPQAKEDVPFADRERNSVVFAGSLTRIKGVEALIKAWPMVLTSCPEARLQIYGKSGKSQSGQSMREVLEHAVPTELKDTVFFHGRVERAVVLEAFSRARVAVFPSRSEAFGMVPLEAMSTGCPTVFSERATGPELIDHERDGLLVDPDSPQQIAQAIVKLLRDDLYAAELGAAGRRKALEKFELQKIVRENERFFLQCIHRFDAARSVQDRRRNAAQINEDLVTKN